MIFVVGCISGRGNSFFGFLSYSAQIFCNHFWWMPFLSFVFRLLSGTPPSASWWPADPFDVGEAFIKPLYPLIFFMWARLQLDLLYKMGINATRVPARPAFPLAVPSKKNPRNFVRLVHGCISNDFCNEILALKHVLKSTTVAHVCTFGIQSRNHEKRLFKASPGRGISHRRRVVTSSLLYRSKLRKFRNSFRSCVILLNTS